MKSLSMNDYLFNIEQTITKKKKIFFIGCKYKLKVPQANYDDVNVKDEDNFT